jgi:hypothetical protein
VSYNTRAWDYSAGYREFGPDFNAPLGFVNRSAHRRGDLSGGYTFRPKGELVTQYGPKLSAQWVWDHATGALQDRELEAAFAVELVASTEFEIKRVEVYELYDGYAFNAHVNQVQAQTEWLKWLGADISYAWGTAVNHDPADGLSPALGRASEVEVGMKIRPTTQLRVEQSYVHSYMHSDPGSERLFSERKWRAKINYQFSRLLSVRTIVDYGWDDFNTTLVDESDPRERKWSMDVLLTYLVHPGTALYLGFTDERKNLAKVGWPALVMRTPTRCPSGGGVFVKASYLLRF